MRYNVGQIIYVILSKKGQVYPMRIIEEITKKTLKGEETNYVAQAGSDTSTKILLNQIEGEIFMTSGEAKNVLIERAASQIEKIIDHAVNKAAEWYTEKNDHHDDVEIHELPQPKEEYPTVKLPDGSVARLKISNNN